MSVIVYGMKMPEHCGYCRFRYDGICHALQKTQYSMEECPLVPVPPHGRLIDADEFIKDECNSCDGACEAIPCDCLNCNSDCRCDFVINLADAPTIIPAERGE